MAVEYNSFSEEPTDSLTEEELKGLVQVKAGDTQPLHRACLFPLQRHHGRGNAAEVTVG